jgi:hypothetical protein
MSKSDEEKKKQAMYAAKHRSKTDKIGRPDARAVQAAVFEALKDKLWIAQKNPETSKEAETVMRGILMAAAVKLYEDYDKKEVLEKIVSMRGSNPFET